MTTIDHDRCSELLPAFVAADLGDENTAAVRDHLATCEQCRAEKAGLEALRAGAEPGLSERERALLHHGVTAAVGAEPEVPVISLDRKRSLGAYAARALGAAAAITIIGTFVYLGFSGGGDADGVAGRDGGGDAVGLFDEDRAEEAPAAQAEAEGGGGNKRAKDEERTSLGAASDTTAGGAPAPPFAIAQEPLTSAQLEDLGESSRPSRTLANYYNAPHEDRSAALLDHLVAEARDQAGDTVAQQVEKCATPVMESEETIIPTFGALGELDGTEAVVVGFAWARSGRSLDSYMVWAWERGDCDVTLEYIEGRIKR